MSDAPDGPKDVSLSIIDTWKVKLPSAYLALPPEFINHVGGIVIAWGMFEKALEDLLTAMLIETGATYKGWQYFSFEQKRGIFETEKPKCFENCPELLTRLTAIFVDAANGQIKRNVLVHGVITLHLDKGVASLVAKGEYKKRQIEERFTTDQINDLYYEVLHIAGRMMQFVRSESVEFVPPLPSLERSRLQDVLSKNPAPRSILTMISHLPRP